MTKKTKKENDGIQIVRRDESGRSKGRMEVPEPPPMPMPAPDSPVLGSDPPNTDDVHGRWILLGGSGGVERWALALDGFSPEEGVVMTAPMSIRALVDEELTGHRPPLEEQICFVKSSSNHGGTGVRARIGDKWITTKGLFVDIPHPGVVLTDCLSSALGILKRVPEQETVLVPIFNPGEETRIGFDPSSTKLKTVTFHTGIGAAIGLEFSRWSSVIDAIDPKHCCPGVPRTFMVSLKDLLHLEVPLGGPRRTIGLGRIARLLRRSRNVPISDFATVSIFKEAYIGGGGWLEVRRSNKAAGLVRKVLDLARRFSSVTETDVVRLEWAIEQILYSTILAAWSEPRWGSIRASRLKKGSAAQLRRAFAGAGLIRKLHPSVQIPLVIPTMEKVVAVIADLLSGLNPWYAPSRQEIADMRWFRRLLLAEIEKERARQAEMEDSRDNTKNEKSI